MRARLLTVPVVALLVLTPLSCAGPGQAAAEDAAVPLSQGTPDASPVTDEVDASHVLATGTLSDASGEPVSHVRVTAYAWPAETPGEESTEIDLTELGSATTDAAGTYRIAADYSILDPLSAYAVQSDIGLEPVAVNVDIVAGGPDGVATWSFPVWVAPDLGSAHVTREDLGPGASPTVTEPTFHLELYP
ncbi:hypothetical protein [Georgenia sp. Marseille-Q6866]